MGDLLDAIQFKLLPIGGLLFAPLLAALWVWRRDLTWRILVVVLACGALGGVALVALLYTLYRIPWALACLDCLASSPWYSVLLTFLQGCGWASVLAVAWWRVRRRGVSEARHAALYLDSTGSQHGTEGSK